MLNSDLQLSVQAHDLSVRFRGKPALDQVSFDLPTGVVGLLGPNGAGKTTLLSVLATILKPSQGQISMGGNNLTTAGGRQAARSVIGWLPQRFDLSGSMTLADTVTYAAWCCGVDSKHSDAAAASALDVVDLTERAKDRVRQLSGGQRQRLGLAAAIAHRPQILLLDEPTTGLDPAQRVRFRAYIQAVGQGRTIILATHLLEDIQHLGDHVLVLAGGKVAFNGAPTALAQHGETDNNALESPLERGYRSLLEQAERDA